jgi:hypothetical protein
MAKRIKVRICAICSKEFIPLRITQVCSYVCALKFNSEKEINKRVKALKIDAQSVGDLKQIARAVFQKWVRLRDAKEPCISCGSVYAKWDGGHYLKAELYSGLIFHEMNVNKQCAYCNDHQAGNLIGYRKGLIEKYGKLAVEGLEEIADESRTYKYTKQELRDIITKYKTKIQELT